MLVDDVFERLTGPEAVVLPEEEAHCLIEPVTGVVSSVGRDEYVFERPDGVVFLDRLVLEDVETGATNLVLLQSSNESFLIDHRAPAHVDDDRAGLHRRELRV